MLEQFYLVKGRRTNIIHLITNIIRTNQFPHKLHEQFAMYVFTIQCKTPNNISFAREQLNISHTRLVVMHVPVEERGLVQVVEQ